MRLSTLCLILVAAVYAVQGVTLEDTHRRQMLAKKKQSPPPHTHRKHPPPSHTKPHPPPSHTKPHPPPKDSAGKGTCKAPSSSSVEVPKPKQVLSFEGNGELIFYCNNNKLEMHGEGGAMLTGTNGWKGEFFYPDDTGLATFKLKNTKSGEKRLIEAKKGPFARGPALDGNAVGSHRRKVLSDTAKTDATWVVRDKCTSARPKPTSTKCNGDQDIIIKYTCTFSFVTC